MKTNLIKHFGFKHPIDDKITYGVEKMVEQKNNKKDLEDVPKEVLKDL